MTGMHAGNALYSGGADPDTIRHIILNMVRTINVKYREKYGNIVFACDSRKSWRKVIFPHYKAHRKNDRDKLKIDWNTMFELFDSVKQELRHYTSWPVIEVEGAEGDDIIATLVLKYSGQPNLIVSADGDFKQLQAHVKVDQWDPINSRVVKEDDPANYLWEHIIRGDRGDGVPNILSDDDTFVNPDKRQGKITDKKISYWKDTDFFEWSTSEQRNFARNKRLIDFREVPPKLVEKIEAEYQALVNVDTKHRVYEYLMDMKLVRLLDSVRDFNNATSSL